jgi:threonine aldolase
MFEDLRFPFSLGSDNHSGVHPRVMQALQEANRGHAHAYGMDELCRLTDLEFQRVFGREVEAQYVFTGTAANVLALNSGLRSFQALVCSEMAHLQVDECGAPEKFLGCKVYTLPSRDGRIFPEQMEELLQRQGDQHFAQPKMVSLTQPTELGVCYTLEELKAWRSFTRERNLMLHIDGARLANAAAHLGCELRDLTAGVGADVVSFGGTKNGLMGAEAVLLFTSSAKENFKFYRKQAMQLSSKTRFMAAQFYAYLKDDLWREIAVRVCQQTRGLAERLREFPELQVAYEVQSNAAFVKLPKSWIAPLREKSFFYIWDPSQQLCRWMISFDWTPADTDRWIEELREVQRCFPIK